MLPDKKLLDALLSSRDEYVYIFDKEGLCLYANAAPGKATGPATGKLVGSHWLSLKLTPVQAKAFQDSFDRILEGADQASGVVRIPVGKETRDFRYVLTGYRGDDEAAFLVAARLKESEKPRRKRRSEFSSVAFDDLLESVPDAMVIVDADGHIVQVNEQAENLFGHARANMLGHAVEMLIPHRFRSPHLTRRAAYLDSPSTRPMGMGMELFGLRKDGTEFPVEVSLSPLERGGHRLVVSSIRDVTERRNYKEALGEREHLLTTIVETVPVVVAIATTEDGMLAYLSPQTWTMLGHEPAEMVGMPVTDLMFQAGDYDLLLEILNETGGFTNMEIRLKHRDGRPIWALVSAKEVPFRDRDAVFLTFNDITELRRLDALANYDALTGLPNRNMLRDGLRRALARADRRGESVGLLFIDLDNFKQINDNFGHHIGDEVLKEASRRMLACVRESDMVARLGGDEFLIFLESLHNEDEAAEIANKLIGAIGAPVELEELDGADSVSVTLSVGIAIYPQHGRGSNELIEEADAAMYLAKNAGKNQYSFPRSHSKPTSRH